MIRNENRLGFIQLLIILFGLAWVFSFPETTYGACFNYGGEGCQGPCNTCVGPQPLGAGYTKCVMNDPEPGIPGTCNGSTVWCDTEAEAQCTGGAGGCRTDLGCYAQTNFGCSNTEEGCNQSADCDANKQCPPNPWSQKVFCCKNTNCVCPELLCQQFPQLPQCQTPTPTNTPINTPTPTATPVPGTARARAVTVPSTTTTCAQVRAGTNYLTTTFAINRGIVPASQVASGGSYATWSNITAQSYTMTGTPPSGYVLKLACWVTDTPAAQGASRTATVPEGGTLTWTFGYTDGAPWFQTQGGDVYAATSLRSWVPAGASPRYMSTNGLGGSPGVVSYGTTYDFDSSATLTGESYISSVGWLVNDTDTSRDYYAIMYHRYDSPTPTASGTITLTQKPAKRSAPYYYDGTVTIDSSDWTIANGEKLVVFVSGDLIIKRKIRINTGGFGAFIVKGTIAVDPTVGGLATSSTPALEGVFITSPTGSFISGQSTNAGTERLVVEGTVIAGDVEPQRDLESVGVNNTTAAELFLYNPELLFTMPDQMKDVPVTWQEVAP